MYLLFGNDFQMNTLNTVTVRATDRHGQHLGTISRPLSSFGQTTLVAIVRDLGVDEQKYKLSDVDLNALLKDRISTDVVLHSNDNLGDWRKIRISAMITVTALGNHGSEVFGRISSSAPSFGQTALVAIVRDLGLDEKIYNFAAEEKLKALLKDLIGTAVVLDSNDGSGNVHIHIFIAD